jgi:hypothetical protein
MADRKISDLTTLTTPASGDYLPIVDISETAASSKNKRITIEELMRGAPDGTAAAPGIAFESDPNTGLYSPGADQVAISTNGTGRLFVDASGNIGVGTASDGKRLLVYGDGTSTATLGVVNPSSTNGAFLYLGDSFGDAAIKTIPAASTTSLAFFVAGANTERMRLDSSGRLGLGTSAPSSKLSVNSGAANTFAANFYGPLANADSILLGVSDDGATKAGIGFQRLDGFRRGNFFVFNNDTANASTDGSISDARLTITSAGNVGIGDNLPDSTLTIKAATSVVPLRVSGPSSEFCRVDTSGRLLIGTSTSTQGGASNFSVILADFTSQFGLALCSTQTTGTANFSQFVYNGTINGSISSNGTTTTYATTSDYRLKENVIPVYDGIARFKQLKPSRFNFIGHPESTVDGFLAHEVQQIVSEAVVGEKDATNEDGTIKPQGIDQSKLVPLLTAALQEAIAKIEDLESRLTAAGL